MDEPGFLRATRESYDALADDYAEHFRDELAGKPLDRAVLGLFAELVRSTGDGPVLDVGSGAGHVTAHLRRLGLAVSGVDLSPGMVAAASVRYPEVTFAAGSMTALDVADLSLAGLVAYYSTIHVPDDDLPGVFTGFHRALAPGGYLLLTFQVGDEPSRLSEALGHDIALDFHRRRPDDVAALLTTAGLDVRIRTERAADRGERTSHAYLVARRPAA
ncbi:methyltransferase family protein [Pseudonocardia sediminis]|uniref:Methyltransferase family protein n=1 Tax=Pseudonocardia sediminis TaxID=1397368 RepID=A0A4Q7V5P2_PSEST|nr:class I SAM-dependent methyltransferase [Pseudonocardia sediminis]RZT88083.1 methyltransferase family protein [Pseudonocardia sediminis]